MGLRRRFRWWMNYELIRFMKETVVYCFKVMRQYLLRKTLGPISGIRSCSLQLCNGVEALQQKFAHTVDLRVALKHNRSEMVAVLGPFEALSYYIHTYG
jgi:hypothetical protein